MTSRMKLRRIGLVLMALVAFTVACDSSGGDDVDSTPAPTLTSTPAPTSTPVPEIITGEVTIDAIIVDTQDAVSKTVSAACSLCRFTGDEDCSGVCPAE